MRVHALLLRLGRNGPSPLYHLFSPAPLSVTGPVMAGTPQEAASRAIGHELSLIGVPAPTTLDGFRPSSADEMKTFMVSVGLSPEQGDDIAKKLNDVLGITSRVQYGWWFKDHSLKDWFDSHGEWATNAPFSLAWHAH